MDCIEKKKYDNLYLQICSFIEILNLTVLKVVIMLHWAVVNHTWRHHSELIQIDLIPEFDISIEIFIVNYIHRIFACKFLAISLSTTVFINLHFAELKTKISGNFDSTKNNSETENSS